MSKKVEVKAPTADNKSVESQILNVVSKLEKKEFTIFFYAPTINSASGGMGVLFKQAKILKDAGYNVKVIFEPVLDKETSQKVSTEDQKRTFVFHKLNPTWLDFDISDIKMIPQVGTDEAGKQIDKIRYNDGTSDAVEGIQLNTEDMVIIPEGSSNVMHQLSNSPCKKIVLAQSWIYILNSLQPGQNWGSFGVSDVISISDAVTEYVKSVMPGVKVKQYSQSINREIFNVPEKISDKVPVIAYNVKRGQETQQKVHNVIRNFQTWHEKNKFVRFIQLEGLSREEYAERLKTCSLLLYTDDIAGFGTAPLEAMACGTHVVGWTPFGGKEYINQTNGFWTGNGEVFDLAESLGLAVDKLLNGELDSADIQASYEATLDRYTQEKEQESILNIFNQYVDERINEIKGIQKK